MVQLTRFNGSRFTINSDLIETIESTPDTVVSLLTGRRFVVRESLQEVLDKIIEFRKLSGIGKILVRTLDTGNQSEE